MLKKVHIFTDGSCLGNPGPGGYGIILRYKKYEKEFSAGYTMTTNNRMELMAVIFALKTLKYSCEVIINTDSKYVCQGITHSINSWKKHGWKTSNKKSLKNLDLWKILYFENKIHIIHWCWLKGHIGHSENERCDELARIAANHPKFKDIGYYFK